MWFASKKWCIFSYRPITPMTLLTFSVFSAIIHDMLPSKTETSSNNTPEREELYIPPSEIELEPNSRTLIDLNQPIAAGEEVKRIYGIAGELYGIIEIGTHERQLLSIIKPTYSNRPFVITSEEFNPNTDDSKGLKGVALDETVFIGRAHNQDRFTHPDNVSRKQCSVSFTQENGLSIDNYYPTNPTRLTAHIKEPDEEIGVIEKSMYTRPAPEGQDKDKAPNGLYQGHPVIGRNSPSVRDGVYFTRGSEALLVDEKSPELNKVYNELSSNFDVIYKGRDLTQYEILEEVMKTVYFTLNYDLDKTDEMCKPYADNQIIELGEFVNQGVGVCRQQALLSAYLIEELIDAGYLDGKVNVERNMNLSPQNDPGGHAWAVFKPRLKGGDFGESVVVDAAQVYTGSKHGGQWTYYLSDDY